jgi:hypothetical protein
MLLRASGINARLRRVAVAILGGYFFNLFLPSTVGGDVVRTMDLFSHAGSGSKIAASVLLDRLSGFVAVVLVAVVSLMVGSKYINDPTVSGSILALAVLLSLSIIVLFSNIPFEKFPFKKLMLRVKKIHDGILAFKLKLPVLVNNLLFSVGLQISGAFIFYFIARSLSIKISPIYFLILVPVVTAIGMFPISIGGLGLRDGACVVFFVKVGMSQAQAFSMSLIMDLFLIALGLLGGAVFLLSRIARRNLKPAS